MKYLLTIAILVTTLSSNAEIITDGTLGQQLNLSGPDFQIGADLGQQHGGNLFHSFQDFNLNSLESATFSGPNNVQNIISRVTGGNFSNIDGLIRSTIPNADMYLLNPYGIMFGPNARLDLQGSFHASTADYLRLGENGRFDVRNPSDSLLTVAPVEAFGFLTDLPTSLSIEGSQLAVPSEKTLSFVGGDLTFNHAELKASKGLINLVSVKSVDEVILDDFVVPALEGNIDILNQSLIDISGEGSGNLFIRGGNINLTNSEIIANSFGDVDNGTIDIRSEESILIQEGSQITIENSGKGQGAYLNLEANEDIIFLSSETSGSATYQSTLSKEEGAGEGGITSIKAKNIYLDGSTVVSFTYGKANAGDINVDAKETLQLKGDHPTFLFGSVIRSSAWDTSNGGNSGAIRVNANDITLMDGAYLTTTTFGIGNSADVTVRARNSITFTGYNNLGYSSGVFAQSYPRKIGMIGNAANILIEADTLLLEDGAVISSNTTANNGQISGKGGDITINVADSIDINGINVHGENVDGFASAISVYSRSVGGTTGDAGNIAITADSLSITDGGMIISSTLGNGNGGQINLDIDGPIIMTGDSSQIKREEPLRGQLSFQRNASSLQEGELVSGIYASSSGNTELAGKGGNILLNSYDLSLSNLAQISSASNGNGLAGNIAINSRDGIVMSNNSAVTTEAKSAGGGGISLDTENVLYMTDSQVTTSVQQSTGSGGYINLNSKFIVLENSKIIARAYEGNGGNMNITTTGIYRFGDELANPIDASSKLGIDGEVRIDSPDMDMEGFLVFLADEVMDASSLMKTPCNQRLGQNLSSLVVKPSEGSPNSPDDLLRSGLLLSENLPITKTTIPANNSPEKLAFSTCKRF